jgi:dihydropteroate synthase
MKWQCAQFTFDTQMPIIMGILNVTPDSFSDGGCFFDPEKAIEQGLDMAKQGAHIIDIGGESTRPGSVSPSVAEEITRVKSVVSKLAEKGLCVSIDTRHAEVAKACISAGASIINDISGFRTSEMVEVAKNSDAGLVVVHMQGEPCDMQKAPRYTDVLDQVYEYLHAQTKMLIKAGIAQERISVDPGPGFGKTQEQTIELVRNFHEFVHLGYPVVAALSRKSFIGNMYHIKNPLERDNVSAKEALMANELGASIIRTHNIGKTQTELLNLRPYALLGLGSNVALTGEEGAEREGKIAVLNQAISALCCLDDTQIIDISSFYESMPAYFEEQDTFINAVVLLRTGIAPKELLEYLRLIENSLGRVRGRENGPRTCDIDILDYQLYCSDKKELTLPHPRLLERDFVVRPLLEILPKHILADGTPVTKEKVCVGFTKECFS